MLAREAGSRHHDYDSADTRPTKGETDAGKGSNGICRVIDGSRSQSPDP